MLKLSIIIPVFNTEKYIRKCIQSCINQNVEKSTYEIIIVNDGSTDSSLSIIYDIANKEQNIIIINQKNGGLSNARNAGLKIAKGEYVWFIDSDDYIERDIFSSIFEVLNLNKDILFFNTIIVDETSGKKNKSQRELPLNLDFKGIHILNESIKYPFSGVQFCIFNTLYLNNNNMRFKEDIYFEDWLFLPECCLRASTCVYIDQYLYYYLLRKGSITNTEISQKKCTDILMVTDNLYMLQNNLHDQNSKKAIAICISQIFSNIYLYYCSSSVDIKSTFRKQVLNRDYFFKSIILSNKYKYLVHYLFLYFKLAYHKIR